MALRQLRYEGDISLKKTCKEVLTVDDKIRELLDDMMDTLRATGNCPGGESGRYTKASGGCGLWGLPIQADQS